MVDYAAGAVCLMAGRLRAALCAPRVEKLWEGSAPTKLRLVSDLQWEIARWPRRSPAAQRPHRSVPVGGFDSRRAPRPGAGWVPACTSGCIEPNLEPSPSRARHLHESKPLARA